MVTRIEAFITLIAMKWLLAGVNATVDLEGRSFVEAFRAVPTLVGFLASVDAHVDFQVVPRREGRFALRTRMRLFAGVSQEMPFQVRALREGLATCGADKRLLTRVRPDMSVQNTLGGEPITAERALKRPLVGVENRVLPKQASSVKSFMASFTLKWLFSRVDHHVHLEVAFIGEGFTTVWTQTSLGFLMDMTMLSKQIGTDKGLVAHRTRVGRFFCVRFHVLISVLLYEETEAAFGALKRLVTAVLTPVLLQLHLLSEARAALHTLVRPIPRVFPTVGPKRGSPRKLLAALFTNVRFDAAMLILVVNEDVLRSVSFPAVGASPGFFVRVGSAVGLEHEGRGKLGGALTAEEGAVPCGRAVVAVVPQGPLGREAFATLNALERSLPSVTPHVLLMMHSVGEAFTTDLTADDDLPFRALTLLAGACLLVLVAVGMSQESPSRIVALAALCTLKLSPVLFIVSSFMIVELGVFAERFAADFAGELVVTALSLVYSLV